MRVEHTYERPQSGASVQLYVIILIRGARAPELAFECIWCITFCLFSPIPKWALNGKSSPHVTLRIELTRGRYRHYGIKAEF